MFKDTDFDSLDDWDDFADEMSVSRNPNNDRDTLRERLNPSQEIEKFKLALIGAYKVVERVSDGAGGFNEKYSIKKMKGFTPMLNKQGIEEVVDYVKDLVNSHTLQSNLLNIEDYNNSMRFTLNRMLVDFVSKRGEWGVKDQSGVVTCVSLANTRFIYSKAKNIIKFTLRRPIGNKEREGLTEAVRETRTGNPAPVVKKPNILQALAGAMNKG